MSQPSSYQQQQHINAGNPLKSGSLSIINGQSSSVQHNQNGSQHYNSTGTPSSQSSRETSRDPSPTQYFPNQYRPQPRRPLMPPINGQQIPSNNSPILQQPPMAPRPYMSPDSTHSVLNPPNVLQKPPGGVTYPPGPKPPTEINNSVLNSPTNDQNTSGQTKPGGAPGLSTQISSSSNQFPINSPNVLPYSTANQRTNQDNQQSPMSNQQNKNPMMYPSIPMMNSSSQSLFNNNLNQQNQQTNQPQSQQHQLLNQQTNQPLARDANLYENPTNAQVLRPPLPPQSSNNQPPYGSQINQNLGSNTYQPGSNQNIYTNQSLPPRNRYPAYDGMPPNPSHPPMPSNLTAPGIPGGIKDAGVNSGIPRMPAGPPPLPGQQMQNSYDSRPPFMGQMSNVPLDNMPRRYPGHYPNDMNQLNTQMGNLSVTKSGFNDLWGHQSVDLLQCRNVLPAEKVEPPKIKLQQEFLDTINCSPDIFRCTLTKVPESNSLLQKSRLPLGILIHPFKDLNHLPLIQCSTIVRCRACRTYINPFVYFVDSKRWKCNLCYRVNELPDEFQFDPVTKSYGDPTRRPEVKTSTIEFIAPSEYMLRPPQPAVYLFILDVSRLAVESGYLNIVCNTISEELSKLPGDSRTQVGFLAIDSAVHFFSMPDNVSQPHELIMLDVDDVFLPCPDNLIVNLKEREELVRDLLGQLPSKFSGTHDTCNALGAGLQAAYKVMTATGGRITVFQTCLPNVGPGALQPREDPNTRASKDVPHLNPATDFYKRLALDCSGQQIAVDLFLLNSQYCDLATISGICKFSGGCIHHLPLFRINKPTHKETLERILRRYLTRKIGFEAVMRIRCTRGLSIHTFHGNFFVRSTDLLSLPNINPDAGFGMQVAIEENLSDIQSVCFQAALLYTSSKGERRIRVHTLCLPVSGSLTDILFSADQQAIIGLVSKMAVDRSQQSSLSDARDALINVAIDALSAYKLAQSAMDSGLMAPVNLKLLPLYIVALLKNVAFRSGTSTRLDDRVYTMCQMKTLPLSQLMLTIYPDLYPIHALDDQNVKEIEGRLCPQPPRLHLSAEKLDFRGAFLMDAGDRIFIYIGKNIDPMFCNNVLGVPSYSAIPEEMYELPELNTPESERLRMFLFMLQEEKPYYATLQIIREDKPCRSLFIERLIEDRTEAALSYFEFLQHLKTQVK
ncbi:protein transport protein Sec24A [Chelonus insularis]|uniref:protein transport protein Sec24A n=1 Tax=Chelonus insularis TaxID=460826 RepID=UPI0015895450|nr:protein transport protein Sec24A [Chelonus insularis]